MSEPRRRTGLVRSLALAGAAGLITTIAGCAVQAVPVERAGQTGPAPRVSATTSGPTASQAMVCGDEIRGQVELVLGLTSLPVVHPAFANGLYTCDYDLPMGRMRLSVHHSPAKPAAQAYLEDVRQSTGADQSLIGLGERAYATGTGTVLVIKDNEVLAVDTTRLPAVFGSQQQKRSDLAYEIASDVLGCWTGDEH